MLYVICFCPHRRCYMLFVSVHTDDVICYLFLSTQTMLYVICFCPHRRCYMLFVSVHTDDVICYLFLSTQTMLYVICFCPHRRCYMLFVSVHTDDVICYLFLSTQTMLEDKLRETDWEVTQESIEEQVARESYLQWLRDLEKNANKQSTNVSQ